MRKNKKVINSIIIFLIIIIGFIFIFNNKFKEELRVESWENVYNENNIRFFYSDTDDEKIKILKQTNNLEEKVKDEKDMIKKAINVIGVINEIITFDDVPSTSRINGVDILKDKSASKKASARDLGIIYRDVLTSLGYTARLGEFKRTNESFNKERSYYVVEYWSKEYNKWIMIDFIDKGYFDNKGFPCSAMELLEVDIRNLNYNGNTDRKDYIPMLKKVLFTYTISIDNTIDMSKSNSYITYIKDKNDISLKFKGSYLPPTIFTENKDLMNKNPIEESTSQDEKAYIVLMKKQEENSDNNIKEAAFIIGGFKDGKILDEYYIRENNGEFVSVKKYKDIILTKGSNTIELSLNGKDVMNRIEIVFK
ncbi:hypothetical protein R0131_12820 [Clostridium sp. AL.422]|uniref:hypothetical protein n=1 Tax=Clostridium TaxID=1485 RepID=UPI00293DF5B1|nr:MULTISPECIES: hypothetical protein [unclassified Clostridium]MDV4151704.1 hypothetical protein [Clostridium sp. AL.422]